MDKNSLGTETPRFTRDNFAELIDTRRVGIVATSYLGRLIDEIAGPDGVTRWDIAQALVGRVAWINQQSLDARADLFEQEDSLRARLAVTGGERYWVAGAILRELFMDAGELLVIRRPVPDTDAQAAV